MLRRNRVRGGGYSLLEVIVVCGIVLFLVGALVAVGGWARRKSLTELCRAEVRMMEAAVQGFAADHGNQYPPDTIVHLVPALQAQGPGGRAYFQFKQDRLRTDWELVKGVLEADQRRVISTLTKAVHVRQDTIRKLGERVEEVEKQLARFRTDPVRFSSEIAEKKGSLDEIRAKIAELKNLAERDQRRRDLLAGDFAYTPEQIDRVQQILSEHAALQAEIAALEKNRLQTRDELVKVGGQHLLDVDYNTASKVDTYASHVTDLDRKIEEGVVGEGWGTVMDHHNETDVSRQYMGMKDAVKLENDVAAARAERDALAKTLAAEKAKLAALASTFSGGTIDGKAIKKAARDYKDATQKLARFEADLADVQAKAGTLQGDLQAEQGRLDALQADPNASKKAIQKQQNKVDGLRDDLTKTQDSIASLKGDVATQQGAVAALQPKADAAAQVQAVEDLEAQVAKQDKEVEQVDRKYETVAERTDYEKFKATMNDLHFSADPAIRAQQINERLQYLADQISSYIAANPGMIEMVANDGLANVVLNNPDSMLHDVYEAMRTSFETQLAEQDETYSTTTGMMRHVEVASIVEKRWDEMKPEDWDLLNQMIADGQASITKVLGGNGKTILDRNGQPITEQEAFSALQEGYLSRAYGCAAKLVYELYKWNPDVRSYALEFELTAFAQKVYGQEPIPPPGGDKPPPIPGGYGWVDTEPPPGGYGTGDEPPPGGYGTGGTPPPGGQLYQTTTEPPGWWYRTNTDPPTWYQYRTDSDPPNWYASSAEPTGAYKTDSAPPGGVPYEIPKIIDIVEYKRFGGEDPRGYLEGLAGKGYDPGTGRIVGYNGFRPNEEWDRLREKYLRIDQAAGGYTAFNDLPLALKDLQEKLFDYKAKIEEKAKRAYDLAMEYRGLTKDWSYGPRPDYDAHKKQYTPEPIPGSYDPSVYASTATRNGASVYVDPFGNPYVYREAKAAGGAVPGAGGHFVIYSIGPNGRDDGGQEDDVF